MEIYLSQFFFKKIKINLKWLSSKLHPRFIEKFMHDHEKFDEASMKRRRSFDAICRWALNEYFTLTLFVLYHIFVFVRDHHASVTSSIRGITGKKSKKKTLNNLT